VDTPGFDVNKEIPRRTNLLLAAVFGNQLPFVKYLVEKGANPNLKEGS
jgi:hypothetical protein